MVQLVNRCLKRTSRCERPYMRLVDNAFVPGTSRPGVRLPLVGFEIEIGWSRAHLAADTASPVLAPRHRPETGNDSASQGRRRLRGNDASRLRFMECGS